ILLANSVSLPLQDLQFRLRDTTKDFTVLGGVYQTTLPVVIGLAKGAWEPILQVENCTAIATNGGRTSFTIKATDGPAQRSWLAYFPSGTTAGHVKRLWEFQLDYPIRGADIQNLVCTGATCTPVVIAGAAVITIPDDEGLQIAQLGSNTLIPHMLNIVPKQI